MNDKKDKTSQSNKNSPVDENPWTLTSQEALDELEVDPDKGLSDSEVSERKERYGVNKLKESKQRSVWEILVEQFKSLIILLLAVAAVLAFLFGENIEGFAIVAAIIINAAIGFFMEWKAVRSMESLQEMGQVESTVRRNESTTKMPAEDLVPGDIVIFEGGDVITADIRIIEANKLESNESALTGESEPAEKSEDPCEDDAPLAERSCMLYKGTAVTGGSGQGVVVTTGMNTELGNISSLIEEVEDEEAPLEKRLDKLARKLIWLTLLLAVFIVGIGLWVGKDKLLIVETAIALAVATIPEGLPIVATVALARGMWRMSKKNALVKQLSAVETLGAANVILTDKTGTLTENKMTVTVVLTEDGRIQVEGDGSFHRDDESIEPKDVMALQESIQVGVLCNNASLEKEEEESTSVGDPMEVALLHLGRKTGMEREQLLEEMPESEEEAFDPDVKMMATVHQVEEGKYLYAVKGAPEAVVEVCTQIRTGDETREFDADTKEKYLKKNTELAGEGLRILALVRKESSGADEEPYQDLTFLSLVGLKDPPRQGIHEVIDTCHGAGIRIVMVTGDQRETAEEIGKAVGVIEGGREDGEVNNGEILKDADETSKDEKRKIIDTEIFARTSPEQKLTLIGLHQESGSIVTMIGDGVNDAPALKKSDIGVAMGKRGTQVAKEAADVILQDDEFSTIVMAIEQGRAIFENIRKFVIFLLSGNLSEVLAVAFAAMINSPLPILPLQILYLNMIIDVYPALALGFGEGEKNLMQKPPRDPKESILEREQWVLILLYGFLLTIAIVSSLYLALHWLEVEQQMAVSISFLTLAFARIWHVWNMRGKDSRLFDNEILRNMWIWVAVLIFLFLIFAALYIPALADILDLQLPGPQGWLLILAMSLMPTVVVQAMKVLSLETRLQGKIRNE